MKRRIVITIVAVVLILSYQYLKPTPEDFSGEDLMQVRDSDAIEYIVSDDDGVLVFWDNGEGNDRGDEFYSLAVDYFKPGFNKWNWVNGGMHSGEYDTGITYQYIPKQALKKFSIAFGVIVDQKIEEIKVEADGDSNYVAHIIKLSNKTIWFVRHPKNITIGQITCYNSAEEIIYELEIDNEWLVE